ncbi:MAG TPA: porin family protein [Desulfuromonadaceae bacterium]|jgi:outer membrane protein
MKKIIALACLATTICLATGTAMADNIKGRLGVTGKIGFLDISDGDLGDSRIKPDVGFIGGGGLIYGVTDNIAAEFDITRSEFGSEFPRSGNSGDFGITTIALGAQYRFNVTHTKLVPYAGGGLDILLNEYDRADVENLVGVHINGGIDYFIMKQVALNVDARAILVPEADIKSRGTKVGNFDPSSFSTTFGVRFFFN